MFCSRRDFLKTSVSVSSLLSVGGTVPTFLLRTMAADKTHRDTHGTILVVVQLTGGNDGLNTVIPYAEDAYAKNRPTLRFTGREVHKIDNSSLGFHPQMRAFLSLYDEGELSIVQGVGYPNSSRQHFRAMRDWQTAQPQDANYPTGWLGRAIDSVGRSEDVNVPAMSVGQTERAFALSARRAAVPAIRSIQDWMFRAMPGVASDAQRRLLQQAAQVAPTDSSDSLLDFVRRNAAAACTTSTRIKSVARQQQFSSHVSYPSHAFAERLKTITQLIRADLGLRIFFTEHGGGGFGGFDNHANQRGNHGAMLHQLAESIAAFVDDLKQDRLLDRVLLMTFSEFGRTVTENGRRGTGHGAAAPVFLAGGRLKPGLVGRHPSLTDLDNDALKYHTDFRQVYATLLDQWLDFDSSTILGRQFPPLDLLTV